jgi:hypothetical protein
MQIDLDLLACCVEEHIIVVHRGRQRRDLSGKPRGNQREAKLLWACCVRTRRHVDYVGPVDGGCLVDRNGVRLCRITENVNQCIQSIGATEPDRETVPPVAELLDGVGDADVTGRVTLGPAYPDIRLIGIAWRLGEVLDPPGAPDDGCLDDVSCRVRDKVRAVANLLREP